MHRQSLCMVYRIRVNGTPYSEGIQFISSARSIVDFIDLLYCSITLISGIAFKLDYGIAEVQ